MAKPRAARPRRPSSYHDWLQHYGRIDRTILCRQIRELREQPLISVVVPIYNPKLSLLETAIDSVRGQIYEHWELCLADDASTKDEVRPWLEQVAKLDRRIKVIFRPNNGHIAACSNSALSLATGAWCALLDQDDVLASDALARVALQAAEFPESALIYSDEDKIDATGNRSTPYFKPDWNPELFLAQNFVNHLGVYRTDLMREVGGFREGFDGSQDYDLVLRCLERLRPEQIRHIPRLLYHWRMARGSVAAVPDAKPYATSAARRAIEEHLTRRGIEAQVEPCPENREAHRVRYSLGTLTPKVSIIIPMRDRIALLQKCLSSIREQTNYAPVEFVIVDNGSIEPETHEYLRTIEAKVVRDEGDFNFSRLTNAGAAAAGGEILLFLNNDIEAVESDWLREMVSHAVRPQVGAVGARLWYPNDTLQHAGVILGLGGVAGHVFANQRRGRGGYFSRALLQQNVSAVTGACLAVRKELFDSLGGMNEIDLPVSFNDIDFCLRLLAAGFPNVWTPYANLIHHESASRGHQPTRAEQEQFVSEATYMQLKWGAELLHDPYYNPNLSLNLPGFELATPPRLAELARPKKRSGVTRFSWTNILHRQKHPW
ncbi:MAG TPA: glycosyltransferase [Chthoniobacterales bacterium]